MFSEGVLASDALLAIGGGVSGTRPAINAAIAAGKPVVLIPSSGGEAQAAWPIVESHYCEEERKALSESFTAQTWGVAIVNAATSIAGRA